jgi:hypothetical protein
VNGLQDLPAILKWELSLAFLVLAWSLVSLGRAGDWVGRLRRRAPAPRNVIPLRRVRVRQPPRPSHPLRALAVALAFAVGATGFAYALPNVIRIAPAGDRSGGPGPAESDRLAPGARPEPSREPSASSGGESDSRGPLASAPRPEPDVHSGSLNVGGSSGLDVGDEPAPVGVPTPEAASPSPAASPAQPDPTPSPEPTGTPLPEPTPTETTPPTEP